MAAPVYDWGKYYALILQSILEGSYHANSLAKAHNALNYYFGLKEGVIDIILSRDLSYASKKLVSILRREIVEGSLAPFSGEIHSQRERIRREGAESLDYVVGEIPPLDRFTKESQEAILSGGFLL